MLFIGSGFDSNDDSLLDQRRGLLPNTLASLERALLH